MSIFSKISSVRPKRTKHDLSYSSKFSLEFGRLCPIFCEKVVPGDKMYHQHEFFMRFAPFANQVFQGFQIRTEYFFVPTRLLWKNFEMWLSKGMLGDSQYVHPFINYKGILSQYVSQGKNNINSIFDYFNLPSIFVADPADPTAYNIDPTMLNDDLRIDPLPFFAYCKIFLDYYADENLDYAGLIEQLENQTLEYATDGNSFTPLAKLFAAINGVQSQQTTSFIDTRFKPFRRSWPKDYFTSALPFAQRGPIVQIPFNGSGDVIVTSLGSGDVSRYQNVAMSGNTPSGSGTVHEITLYGDGDVDYTSGDPIRPGNSTTNETRNKLTFRAVNVNGTGTITDLRTAIAIQNFLEKRARGGSRAKEQIYSSFGVRSKDYRLDRSELLQANTNYLNIGEVYTATANESDTDVPGMAISTGKAANSSKRFKHFFEEHGYVIGLMSVFPTASYFQGIPRQFMELDQFDYYWPEFQHIGEQDVKKQELFLDDEGSTDGVFGYQPRYSQYKSRLSQIHGEFRQNLEFMVAARKFNAPPTLSNSFVQINPDRDQLNRVFRTVTPMDNSNPVYVDLYHHNKMVRPMDYYGIPRFV